MKKGKKIVLGIAIALLLLVVVGAGVIYLIGGKGIYLMWFSDKSAVDVMEARHYTDENGVELPYRIFVPDSLAAEEELPLVLYLHGAGERGDDNEKQVSINHVMQTLLTEENREQYPCIVLAPQCPEGETWSKNLSPEGFSAQFAEQRLAALYGLIEQTATQYSVDRNRIYITGVSMGGFGTWDMLMHYPDTFAAAVPICGGSVPADAARLKDIPIWVFHGGKDTIVPTQNSRDMVQALKDAGSTAVRYTEYPMEHHFSWELAYREEELFPWLFAQQKAAGRAAA